VAVDDAIAEKLEFVAQNPFLSSIFRQTSTGEVREVLAANYRIFFVVNEPDQQVVVRAIRHVRQQDPDFPE
jgi:plasmid stabilization system protein ParE